MLSVLAICEAAETNPVVGPGATRDEVIAAYGWPNGQSQTGEREIFTYPQGSIELRSGVVERMDFSPNVAWPKPRPRPALPTAVTKPVPAAGDAWLTDFTEALREAGGRRAPILMLFTGTDWSPPCKRFQSEVANHPDFLAATGDLVLLRLDFPTRSVPPAGVRQQNAALRERFNVTTYPTLVLLTAEGDEMSRVNLAKARPQPTYREQAIAAIAEARPQPAPLVYLRGAPTTPESLVSWVGFDAKPAILGGAVLLLCVCWWLIRRRTAGAVAAPAAPTSILPTPADIATWSGERVRDVAAALFEYEGSRVQVRPGESGAELALFLGNEERPRTLVHCQPASAGLAGAKAVRGLFATIVMEGVERAWYVSPGGFTAEARQFAGEHPIVLIGGEELLERLKAMPPLALMHALEPPR